MREAQVERAIPLQAVRDALMCAQVRRAARHDAQGKPLARFGAYSQYPSPLGVSCREALRGMRYRQMRHHFGPMHRGDVRALLERVRCEHGLAEIRRTWGVGKRAMQADFADGVLR